VVFFGLLLPVLFLLIFATVFGNDTIRGHGGIKASTYYVPTLITLGIVSTTFVSVAISLAIQREDRQLKRLRGTPLPMRAFMAGQLCLALAFALALTVVLLLLGKLLYGASIPGRTLPGVALSLVVGAAALNALGVAMSAAIPNEDAGPPMVNAVVLPLYFISGVFFDTGNAPSWLNSLADVFPIKHLAQALLTAFDPRTSGAGIAWGHLAVVAGWGVAGAAAALLFFRWTPKGE
jgi:ABC-2 type transport system permease protein